MKTKCSQRLKRSQLLKIYLTKKSYRLILKLRQWNVLTVEERNLETAGIFTTVHKKKKKKSLEFSYQDCSWAPGNYMRTAKYFQDCYDILCKHSTFSPLPILKIQSLKLLVWLSQEDNKGEEKGLRSFLEGMEETNSLMSSRIQVAYIHSFFIKKINSEAVFKPGYPVG